MNAALDRERLAKLLGMLGSTFDGEVVSCTPGRGAPPKVWTDLGRDPRAEHPRNRTSGTAPTDSSPGLDRGSYRDLHRKYRPAHLLGKGLPTLDREEARYSLSEKQLRVLARMTRAIIEDRAA